ncbi:TetR/AcrR family transcriptional regulator [Paenibacillus sp. TAB 01]|uniref:TetR/AcrR family transcriptional regulator n=1 Tax=Paenibacillus sp. TAB 01 TaxID=3368988 RepID=UPI003752A80B
MNKPDDVREKIINEAMLLFNTRGIAQTSIQDIMQAAALPKGAIYRRFENKEMIVLAAFERAKGILLECFVQAEQEGTNVLDKLMKVSAVYQDAVNNPPIPGGCPLLNMAVESDGSFPELQQKAHEAYQAMVQFVGSIIDQGIRNAEIRPDTDAIELASFLTDSLEGAIMASRLTGSADPIQRYMKYVERLVRSYMMDVKDTDLTK